MKRLLQTVCLICVLWACAVAVAAQTVVLDPGHGGADSGAVSGNGVAEKDLNLALALLLRQRLTDFGYPVVMTRCEDADTDGKEGFYKRRDLDRRVTVAAESDAVLFVSLHMNASTSETDKGFQIFYANCDGSKEAAAAIRSAVERADIVLRMRELKAVPSDLYIFRRLAVPSVLVECGFLSNPDDEALLTDRSFTEKMADALAQGISDWLKKEKF